MSRRFVLISRFYPRMQDKCIAYNILDCIGSKIDYKIESIYLSTNNNQEILADEKGVRLLHLSDHISLSI
jgi:hypothetical protein